MDAKHLHESICHARALRLSEMPTRPPCSRGHRFTFALDVFAAFEDAAAALEGHDTARLSGDQVAGVWPWPKVDFTTILDHCRDVSRIA